MKYKALFLDFYGTLVHEDDVILAQIAHQICQNSPCHPPIHEVQAHWNQYFQRLILKSNETAFVSQRQIEKQSIDMTLTFLNCTNHQDFTQNIFEYWQAPVLYEDTKPFLAGNRLPICIVSNIDRADILAALDYHHLSFDALITSEDAKCYKPRQEIFQMALDEMKLLPDQVLFVGDSMSSDVAGAHACGMHSFWLNRRERINPLTIMPTYQGEELGDIFEVI